MEPILVINKDDSTGTVHGHGRVPEYVMIDSDCPIAAYAIRYGRSRAGAASQEGNTCSANYWSATENNATNAWNVNFSNGNTNNNNKTNSNRARCVR